jgi:molybdopterin synthase catalytic subunit
LFEITSNPIDCVLKKDRFLKPGAGALVTFEGLVRDENEGQEVESLEYEIYESLAQSEGNKIVEEARSLFAIIDAYAIHRQGHLELSEIAVWIWVTAKHRTAAFQACQYIIDQIKLRLPVWKKENYRNGTRKWVNCQESHRSKAP